MMWMIVKFHEDDEVSAVPSSWIKKLKNVIKCFWPRKNVEKKRRCSEIPVTSEGKYYPCRILMKEKQFGTFDEALNMEIEAQTKSSVETNDEKVKSKRKRIPKKYSSTDESENDTRKKRKCLPKKFPKNVPSFEESSDFSSSEEPNCKRNFVFKKSKVFRLKDAYKTFEIATHKSTYDAESLINCGKKVTVLDMVILPADGNTNNLSNLEGTMNQANANLNDVTNVTSVSISSAASNLKNSADPSNSVDVVDFDYNNVCTTDNDICFDVITSPSASSNSSASAISNLTSDGSSPVLNTANSSQSMIGNTSSDKTFFDETNAPFDNDPRNYEYNSSGIQNVGEIIELTDPPNNQPDISLKNLLEHVNKQHSEINSKLDSAVLMLEGLKKVIVDLTNKVLRLEDQGTRNMAYCPLTEELSLPMNTPEAFTNNENVLLNNTKAADNLVSYLCSVNFENEFRKYIKTLFNTLFNMKFFYLNVVWSAIPEKKVIKDTQIMACIIKCIKTRFPEINLTKIMLDEEIHACGKQLKDCFRKSKEGKLMGKK